MTTDHDDLVEALLPALTRAALLQLGLRTGDFVVARKADASPVTDADHRSEAELLAALAQIAPGVPVVAEESAAAGRVPEPGERFFLVDPLDGTREYIEGRPEFTINVALVEHGRPVMGIVAAPALGEVYATRGRGAAWVRLPRPGDAPPPLAQWSAISTRPRPADGLVAVCSRSHADAERAPRPEAIEKLVIRERRRVGSSIKFCLIARGDADVYARLGPTSEWDTAAGQAILEAAGGCVMAIDGRPLGYGHAARGFRNPHFVAWGRAPGG